MAARQCGWRIQGRRIAGMAMLWTLCWAAEWGMAGSAPTPPAKDKKPSDAIDELFRDKPHAPPAKPTPKPPTGIDQAQTSADPTYGYTKDNPIKLGLSGQPGKPASTLLGGVRAEKLYLSRLRDSKLRPFKCHRRGSLLGPHGHVLDRYVLVGRGARIHTLYLDMYHPQAGLRQAKAPKGMYLLAEKRAAPAP